MDKQSYTIKFVITGNELNALKKALASYKGAKNIMADLLGIVERQEGLQNGRKIV